MENITDKVTNIDFEKLSEEKKTEIASKIFSDFKTYDEARSEDKKVADLLIKEIFFKNSFKKSSDKDKNKDWKSDIKMCKLFMFYQTLKSFIWKNTYSGISSMFDVSGESQHADSNSNKQKAMLVDILEKMEYAKISDNVIDNSLIYGELISFTSWKKRTEQYRRPVNFFEAMFNNDIEKLPLIIEAKMQGKNFYIDERVVYDNPVVVPVNPADFVFDVTQDDFDRTPKIYRTWRTPEDIINNEAFVVNKEIAEALKVMVKNEPDTADNSDQSKEKLNNLSVNGSTVAVYEFWGNFTDKDGKVYKNCHIVSVAEKYLVRFSDNEYIINPFSFGAFVTNPYTKRGISPLASVLGLVEVQEKMLNKTVDLQALTENPPILSPEGFFDEEDVEIYPGKVIPYDPSLYNANLIHPMTFNPNVFLNDITFISDLMSEICGVFPNMVGAEEKTTKTATEISVKTQGQTTRLSMILDIINQYYIIPTVKNVAKLCANFKFGKENLYINKDNNPEDIVVDDSVRQGEYRYVYSDRNATVEKLNYADMLIIAIEKFAQFVPLNMEQVFTWYMEQKGVENPEKFLIQQQNNGMPNNMNLDVIKNLIQKQQESNGGNGMLPQPPQVAA